MRPLTMATTQVAQRAARALAQWAGGTHRKEPARESLHCTHWASLNSSSSPGAGRELGGELGASNQHSSQHPSPRPAGRALRWRAEGRAAAGRRERRPAGCNCTEPASLGHVLRVGNKPVLSREETLTKRTAAARGEAKRQNPRKSPDLEILPSSGKKKKKTTIAFGVGKG